MLAYDGVLLSSTMVIDDRNRKTYVDRIRILLLL